MAYGLSKTIARIIVEEIVPFFGVPEALLSGRGTNLLLHLRDICRLLGIKKLNTTAHHPECDSAVERFNRTLKTMQAARHGAQWDQYIHGVVWAYRNNPHSSTIIPVVRHALSFSNRGRPSAT